MNLGQAMNGLEKFSPGAHLRIEFIGRLGVFTPTNLASYRGFYDQMALGYERSTDKDFYRVRRLHGEINAQIGRTFLGYKGGEYRADRDTPLWVSEWGESENWVPVEFVRRDGVVFMRCAQNRI